jgi:hypothetical protein
MRSQLVGFSFSTGQPEKRGRKMSILFPVFAMVLIAFVVGPLILTTRLSSVKNGVVTMEYYEIFRGGEPPANVVQTTRHWSNLFEAPTLFYIACLMAFSLQLESTLLLGIAWAYVAVRLVHSVIHLTYNSVYHRLAAFLASQVILVVMWILIFIEVI